MFRSTICRLFLLMSISFFLNASESTTANDIKLIDQEIILLKEQLKNLSLDKNNEEVEMQRFMIADWSKYSKDALEIKSMEDQEEALQKRIQALEEQKSQLLQHSK